jgi:hypothetical protein
MRITRKFCTTLMAATVCLNACGHTTVAPPVQSVVLPAVVQPNVVQGTQIDTLLTTVPAASHAAFYLDFASLMRSEALQTLMPIAMYQPGMSRIRAACTERLWQQFERIVLVYGAFENPSQSLSQAMVFSGPGASNVANPCAAILPRNTGRTPALLGFRDGVTRLAYATDGMLARLQQVTQHGETLDHSDSFVNMPAALPDVRFEAVVDVAAMREHYAAELAMLAVRDPEIVSLIRHVRAVRLEIAETQDQRFQVRIFTRYNTAQHASEAVASATGDNTMPPWLREIFVVASPTVVERSAMMLSVSEAYGRWIRATYQPRVTGRDVVFETTLEQGYVGLLAGLVLHFSEEWFQTEAARVKTDEARTSVQRIAETIATRWNSAPRVQRRIPVSIPATPAAIPGVEPLVDPAGTWDAPAWHALDFRHNGPHYYVYSLTSDRTSFTVRATGDLDGDGDQSVFSITGRIAPNGTIQLGNLQIEDEFE